MVFLANENFPSPSIKIIENAGYEIISISEKHPGINDNEVVALAQKNGFIILTFDKDYGEILFKHAQQNPPSVVFFRFHGDNPESAGKTLVRLLKENISLENRFTVVEKENLRQRSI
jgi:predicted nuclease of predicted toxin-antitoxin system